MAFPTALALWTALGGLTAYRALVRPSRAIIDVGSVVACSGGPGCSPGLTVQSDRGVGPVYALVSGRVTRVNGGGVELAGALEAVLLAYSGPGLVPVVMPGQSIRAGEIIARGETVSVGVTQIVRLSNGALGQTPLEPASWLATRGLRAVTHAAPSAAWCAQGRKLVVPQDVARCGIRLADPPGFSLLPVSARME